MPTLFLHALHVLFGLLPGDRWATFVQRMIREVAYARITLRWAQMCADPDVFDGAPTLHQPADNVP